MKTFNPFTKGRLDDVLRNQLDQITNKINTEQENYLLNVNEEEYIDHLVSEFTIDTPTFDYEAKTVSSTEKMIPAERHPSSLFFLDDMDKSYKRQVITYHIPFSGDVNVLDYMPNPSIMWTQEFTYNDKDGNEEISFEVINFGNDPETIKRESEQTLNSLRVQLEHVSNQVNGHNSNLKQEITQRVQMRKKDISQKSDFLSQLGVPIKKRESVPETFAIPTPKIPKKIIPRPSVSTIDGKQDPTVDVSIYKEILSIIHDVGKAIERMPSTYEGKSEEELRDHFLMVLEPRFQGSATGETFNKNGKTDILLRYENSNVFVAECKYWGGEKIFLDTIDQILGYLTWRDSKAAIMLFVKNADFTSIIQKVKDTIISHPNFVSLEGENDETWLNYKISLKGDSERKIYLAVLLFHFPEVH